MRDENVTCRKVFVTSCMRLEKKSLLVIKYIFSRQENARGSVMPTYREDWAFRATYSYAGRYNIEYNGAYNGSEKFSKDNRFAFFNSGAIG